MSAKDAGPVYLKDRNYNMEPEYDWHRSSLNLDYVYYCGCVQGPVCSTQGFRMEL